MKKLKKLFLCVFMFLISFTMFGCASVNLDVIYAQKQDNYGNQFNVVTANMNIKLETSTYWKEIHGLTKEYFNQLNNAYVNNIVSLYSNVYDFNALDTTEDKSMYDETREKYDYILSKTLNRFLVIYEKEEDKEEFKADSKTNTINIKKEFISIYGYIMYCYPSAFEYNPDKNAVVISDSYKSLIDIPIGGGFKQEENLFTVRSIQYCTPFYYNGQEPTFLEDNTFVGVTKGQKLMDALTAKTGKTEDDLQKLGFSFSTPYKRVHSDGEVNQTQNGYTHTWTLGNIGSTVSVWRTYANSPAWYIIAGVTGILIVVIGFVVVSIVNNNKKRKGMKALKQLDQLARQQEQEENKNDK
ncbi:MAG: hypothetical protein IJB10_04540 [Clostridia bacterium]|nr:hypothetical protein [Clostridia bacterium]